MVPVGRRNRRLMSPAPPTDHNGIHGWECKMRRKKMTLEEWNQMCHKWVRGSGRIDHDPKCPCGTLEPKPSFRKVKS